VKKHQSKESFRKHHLRKADGRNIPWMVGNKGEKKNRNIKQQSKENKSDGGKEKNLILTREKLYPEREL
jgi:hypothetical protein